MQSHSQNRSIEPENILTINKVPEHCHPSNISKVDFMTDENTEIQRAVGNITLPHRVILGEVSKLNRQVQAIPKSGNTFVQTLQRACVKAGGHTIVPRTFDEAVTMIPDHMKLSGNGDRLIDGFRQMAGLAFLKWVEVNQNGADPDDVILGISLCISVKLKYEWL